MTDHSQYVEGCLRCGLSSDEVTSGYITDAMVVEALEASYDPPKEPGHTFLNRDSYRSLWKHHMRAALEAAAPAIAAKALRDFADGMTSGFNKETLNAERRAIKREARACADKIERGES